jgi:type IV fimbrial biogenesis protein FimT
VLVIAAIVLGVSLPALGELLRHYQLRLAAADLLGAVDLARSQAIAHGGKVLLVPTADSLDWAEGWTVFIDRDGDRRPGAGDEVLMRHPPVQGGIKVDMAFGGQQGPPYLAYNSAGRGCAHGNSLAPRFGTVTLTLGRRVRRIKINMLGRARLCDPSVNRSQCDAPDS